jgi:enoyl-CoA hydratase
MPYETVLLDFEGPVALLTLNRPKALNALSAAVLEDLSVALAEVAARPDCRALIVTGAGPKAFVAGADITAMSAMTPAEALAFARRGQAVLSSLESLPVPVIAAINGFALGGGCELALCCDILYASDNAVFGQPEVKLGVVPGFGGTARLVRRIGPGAAMEWILAGDNVSAQEAFRLGLVQKVVVAEDLLKEARELAGDIAARAPLAVAASRALVRAAQDRTVPEGLAAEAEAFATLFATADRQEGMEAFLQRRPVAFRGR